MTTEARMNEPSPIVAVCEHFLMATRWFEGSPPGETPAEIEHMAKLERERAFCKRVVSGEVVPVPDEQAIERAAKALRRLIPFDQDHAELVRAVLAAALEQSE
jgi:hypothetical protein